MRTKTAVMKMKDGSGLDDGQFIGYASVFGNIDSYGDKVMPGAFKKTLAGFGDAGAGIPCYWMHRLDDPELNIGQTVEAVEDEHGLKVTVQLDLENPKARYVHSLIKQGRVKEMSFAYDVTDGEARDDCYEIKAVDLFEVSVVPVGANRETELLGVKAAEIAAHLATAPSTPTDTNTPDEDGAGKAPDTEDEEGAGVGGDRVEEAVELLKQALDYLTRPDDGDGTEDGGGDDTATTGRVGESGGGEEPGKGQPATAKTLAIATALLALTRAGRQTR